MSVPIKGAGSPQSQDEQDERRRFERIDLVWPIRVFRERSIHERVGVTTDVSLGGMLFRTRASYAVGERIWVAWSSEDGDTRASSWATVVRANTEAASLGSEFPRMVAIEFDLAVAA